MRQLQEFRRNSFSEFWNKNRDKILEAEQGKITFLYKFHEYEFIGDCYDEIAKDDVIVLRQKGSKNYKTLAVDGIKKIGILW